MPNHVAITAMLTLLAGLQGCAKEGGPCHYQTFSEQHQITDINGNNVSFEAGAFPTIHLQHFNQPPHIGDNVLISGKRIVQGSCTPLMITSITAIQAE